MKQNQSTRIKGHATLLLDGALVFLEHLADGRAKGRIDVPATLQNSRDLGIDTVKGRAPVLLDHLTKLSLCRSLETGRGEWDFSSEDFKHKHADAPYISFLRIVFLAQ